MINEKIQLSPEEIENLLQILFYKKENWVIWGKTCNQLHKAGVSAQDIFEKTGFQTVQQNLIIVASQVYESLEKGKVSQEILSYYTGPRSDVLYEFRILNQEGRIKASVLAYEKQLDVDMAHQVAKAIQDYYHRGKMVEGFTDHAGDIVAFQFWRQARQKRELQDRSRLIAQGLKFVHSTTARQQIEQLLSDFTIVKTYSAPLLPIHRVEEEEELPRIIPVAGVYPLSSEAVRTTPALSLEEPFCQVTVSGTMTIVPVPGWQTVLKAVDPVGIFWRNDQLPQPITGKPHNVLVVVDRTATEWTPLSYFLVEKEGKIAILWAEEAPSNPVLGQVILVLRPKRILDESIITTPWQMDD